ncbi:MAG TPA: hypothetical protein QGH10_07565, partial [Armatimonadota bacterium]|nr:hypothetical protein [Armatimonadota bacterium]
ALRMAHEADTKADEAQDPKDARRKKADAKAMRDLAEAWQTAGRAFDDALAKRKIADSPPGPLQGPDPAKKKEAEIALAAARGLWEAAAILLDAEEVRRGAVEAKEAGDKKAGRILDGVRRELLKAAEAWKKAAAAAGEGKEKARLAHEKAAKNHYRAAGALEEERDEEDIPGKQPKPKGQKSSGLFKKAAEAWEEIALARKAAPGAIVAANALTAAARATSASDAAWAEGHDVAGDAWGRAACCWLAISGKQASNPGLVEALSLGAGLWEKAGEALSVGEKFGAPYLKTARSYPSTESLVEAAKATGPSKPLDRQQSKRERK